MDVGYPFKETSNILGVYLLYIWRKIWPTNPGMHIPELSLTWLVVWNHGIWCSPIVGMMIQSDFHIFQGGWNWNHQLVTQLTKILDGHYFRWPAVAQLPVNFWGAKTGSQLPKPNRPCPRCPADTSIGNDFGDCDVTVKHWKSWDNHGITMGPIIPTAGSGPPYHPNCLSWPIFSRCDVHHEQRSNLSQSGVPHHSVWKPIR